MNIIVEEEFGYQYYTWKSPFTNEPDLLNWWHGVSHRMIQEVVFPSGCLPSADRYQSAFGGEWVSCKVEDIHGSEDGYMHIHTPEDSFLEIGEDRYYITKENSDEHSTLS